MGPSVFSFSQYFYSKGFFSIDFKVKEREIKEGRGTAYFFQKWAQKSSKCFYVEVSEI